jgi:hypothetical protein
MQLWTQEVGPENQGGTSLARNKPHSTHCYCHALSQPTKCFYVIQPSSKGRTQWNQFSNSAYLSLETFQTLNDLMEELASNPSLSDSRAQIFKHLWPTCTSCPIAFRSVSLGLQSCMETHALSICGPEMGPSVVELHLSSIPSDFCLARLPWGLQ